MVQEQRLLTLPDDDYDPAAYQIRAGLYDPLTLNRLPVLDENGTVLDDGWMLLP